MVNGLINWLKTQPKTINLRQVKLNIKSIKIGHFPITYQQLFQTPITQNLALSFISPTSFRRKGHHFPLPLPFNVFHSYLRRLMDRRPALSSLVILGKFYRTVCDTITDD
jgi:CRISPR-associated endoribonuclease Cas6